MKNNTIAEFNGKDNTSDFLGGAMKAFENQVQAMKVIYNNMQAMENKIESTAKEIQDFKRDFEDNNRLLPSEVGEIEEAVRMKSVEIVQAMGVSDSEGLGKPEEFGKQVGKVRRKTWIKVKKRIPVSQYVHIPRKRFQESLDYIRDLSISDFSNEFWAYRTMIKNENQVHFDM